VSTSNSEGEPDKTNNVSQRTKEQKDEFLSIVSHELRSPITTIKGNVQLAKMRLLLAMHSLPAGNDTLVTILEEIQLMLDRVERQANVQNQRIKDLLDSSRIQLSQLDLQKERANLITIVHKTMEDLQSASPARRIQLIEPAEESISVLVDAERIGQVINNYVTNALKYSPEDRPVEAQMEKRGSMVRFSVRDQGPGLSPSEQVHIWERFYQVEGIKRQRGFTAGMGLGLYICRAIIEQHQGEVGVESIKDEGSAFWFTLPVIEDEQ
jgi:signal transduction histidine kinase